MVSGKIRTTVFHRTPKLWARLALGLFLAVSFTVICVQRPALAHTPALPQTTSDSVALAATGALLTTPTIIIPGDFPAPHVRDHSPAGSATSSEAERGSVQERPPIPGIGADTMAEVPAEATQVLVSTTSERDGTQATTTLYERTPSGWEELKSFSGHNGKNGWKRDRHEGDKTTPIGVFSITDAGGYLEDPGTELPYTQSDDLRKGASRTYGEEFPQVFDYVIAINYNRKPGTPPTDGTRPHGWEKGGDIWLHVDHASPTLGCVTIDREDVKYLLKTLDPDQHPHIILGPQDVISQ